VNESSFFSPVMDSPALAECFLNLPNPDVMRKPIDVDWLQENQFEDLDLYNRRADQMRTYPIRNISGRPIIHYQYDPDDENEMNWKIAIPQGLLENMVKWFHEVLGHAGESRVYDSIRARYYHPRLKSTVQNYIRTCETCRKHKLSGSGFGELAERDVNTIPWQEVHIDLIGPWNVRVNDIDVQFNALTVINPATNLVELIRIEQKTADHVAQKFANCWLSRYPWPEVCVYDNGGEFIGVQFQQLLEQCGIRDWPTTSRNPQANAICERMHQTVGNILRTLLLHGGPVNANTANNIVDDALATASHALRATVSRSLGNYSPGELAFQRNMFLNLPLIADLQVLHDKRSEIVPRNLDLANQRRIRYDYQPGESTFRKEFRTRTYRQYVRTQGTLPHTYHT